MIEIDYLLSFHLKKKKMNDQAIEMIDIDKKEEGTIVTFSTTVYYLRTL